MWDENGVLGNYLARFLLYVVVACLLGAIGVSAWIGDVSAFIVTLTTIAVSLAVLMAPYLVTAVVLMLAVLGTQHLVGWWRNR